MSLRKPDNPMIDERQVTNLYGLSVDVVLLGYRDGQLFVFTKKPDLEQYDNLPSLLGTLVRPDERLMDSARRILGKYTGLADLPLVQIGAFDELDRHPVKRVVSIAYLSMINMDKYTVNSPAHEDSKWMPVESIHEMAFDHFKMFQKALAYARNYVDEITAHFDLLPDVFTIGELRKLHETILEDSLDKRNFRKRILKSGLLTSTGKIQKQVSHRPAELFVIAK